MAALIKNALIKQISKFLKNVTPNQINISTLKGEGEMTNIQLDENVLMDLLELPLWLRITSARCNRANVKVPWTKLKTNPIVIGLDKIDLDMEIADPIRQYHPEGAKLFDKESQGAYGYIDKCIDAIQLNIDSVNITIKSNLFNANLNISNIYIFSTTPHWRPASDIRMTRLKDLDRDEIILYKVITWEICRLEVFNMETAGAASGSNAPTSIKLIMNPSQMQIALKKKLSDKSLVNSTVRVMLNEIYWMANDTQLKAAIGTYNSLSKLMKKAFSQKIKFAGLHQTNPNKPKTSPGAPTGQQPIDISKVFMQYDIKETSLHLEITNLNIHLYADDNYSGNKQIDGGAMQVLFKNLCIDHYPYHKIGSSISHWHNYNYAFKQRDEWSKGIIGEFVAKLDSILSKSDTVKDLNKFKLKNSVNLLEACTIVTLRDLCVYKVTTNMSDRTANVSAMKTTKKTDPKSSQPTASPLRSPNDILGKSSYFIDQQLFDRRPFLSSNYAEFNLPADETLFASVIFSEFYFPDECNYPLPSPQLFVQCSPIILNIDFLSLLWVNTLLFSLYREKLIVDESELQNRTPQTPKTTPTQHCDTYIELITPKMSLSIYPTDKLVDYDSKTFVKRPSTIELGVARLFLTNSQLPTSYSKKFTDLKPTSDRCYQLSKSLCAKYGLFGSQEALLQPLAPCFTDVVKNQNCSYQRFDLSLDDDLASLVNTANLAYNAKEGLFLKTLSKNALYKNAAKDLWSVEFESAWIDFRDPVTKDNTTFIENTSFRFYMVNVWDFYSNGREPEATAKKPNGDELANYQRAYSRLSKLIELNTNGADTNGEPEIASPVSTKRRKKRSISVSGTNALLASSSSLSRNLYSQVNVIGEIKELNVATNHAQVLFLLRLVDTMDLFTNQLKTDSEHTLKYKANGSVKKEPARPKIKCLNLEDLAHIECQAETENDATSVNLALSIRSLQVDLIINDLRKPKTNPRTVTKPPVDSDSDTEPGLDTTADTTVQGQDANKEFVSCYLKYIYGLSSENPNQSVSVRAAYGKEPSPTHALASSSIDSGFTDKSGLTVSFSNSSSVSFSTSGSQAPKGRSSTVSTPTKTVSPDDPFADDGDNISMILNLETDDSSSLVNIELGNKAGNNISSQSASDVSAGVATVATTPSDSQSLFKPESGIELGWKPTVDDRGTQTEERTLKIRLRLTNMEAYVQLKDDDMAAMARIDRLAIENLRSDKGGEILIRFRKLPKDVECHNGLADVLIENLKLNAYMFNILGLVELIDDDDEPCAHVGKKKETLPANVTIKNTQINLSEDPGFQVFEDDPKLLPITIERLELKKLSNGAIQIREAKLDDWSRPWPKNGLLHSPVGLKKEIDYLNQFKYDLTFLEFNSKFKFNSSKFASLVYLLRQAKENSARQEDEKSQLRAQLDKVQADNEILKRQLEMVKSKTMDEAYLESAIRAVREENETLRKKLETTEEAMNVLRIEREQYLKLLNEK